MDITLLACTRFANTFSIKWTRSYTRQKERQQLDDSEKTKWGLWMRLPKFEDLGSDP